MRRRLLAGFLVFALVVVVLLEVPLGLSLARNARTTALAELENSGASLGLLVGSSLQRRDTQDAAAIIARFAKADHARVVLIAGHQLVMAAGTGAAEEMADPPTRAIITTAEAGRTSGEEGAGEPDDDQLYAAVPIALSPSTRLPDTDPAHPSVGVVLLVTEPAGPLHARITSDWIRLSLFGAAMLAIAAGVGTLLARSLTRSLGGIEAAVAAFGAGRLTERAPPVRGPTELKALGATVNEMADRLQDLLNAQRAFVADASHQLRTPMTALRLRLENLEGSLDADGAADLAPAIAEADRLSRVVDGLLSLARSDGSGAPREAIEVVRVLAERVDAWTALADERRVALSLEAMTDGTRPALTALACKGHLEQILDNLLSNALDATPPGGTVRLEVERVDEYADIHVVDTGGGMGAADRGRAFDRFWRPEGAQHEGSGLGLAIVSQLVRVSGGTVWLDAADDGGIDAVVRLEAC